MLAEHFIAPAKAAALDIVAVDNHVVEQQAGQDRGHMDVVEEGVHTDLRAENAERKDLSPLHANGSLAASAENSSRAVDVAFDGRRHAATEAQINHGDAFALYPALVAQDGCVLPKAAALDIVAVDDYVVEQQPGEDRGHTDSVEEGVHADPRAALDPEDVPIGQPKRLCARGIGRIDVSKAGGRRDPRPAGPGDLVADVVRNRQLIQVRGSRARLRRDEGNIADTGARPEAEQLRLRLVQ
jgi:hypothetical protein